jgi:hypothetical protein
MRVTVSSPTDGVHLVHPAQHVPTHEPLDEVAVVGVLEEGQRLAGPVRVAGHQLVAAGQDGVCDQQSSEVFAGCGQSEGGTVALPMRLWVGAPTLGLFSTVATFGTPRDVAASELAIETFLPADDATRRWLAEANG